MHAVHTPGPPPNHGKDILAINGWTWKSRKAPIKVVSAKMAMRDYVETTLTGNRKRAAEKRNSEIDYATRTIEGPGKTRA